MHAIQKQVYTLNLQSMLWLLVKKKQRFSSQHFLFLLGRLKTKLCMNPWRPPNLTVKTWCFDLHRILSHCSYPDRRIGFDYLCKIELSLKSVMLHSIVSWLCIIPCHFLLRIVPCCIKTMCHMGKSHTRLFWYMISDRYNETPRCQQAILMF